MLVTFSEFQLLVDEYLPGWKAEIKDAERRIAIKHPELPGTLSLDFDWFLFRDSSDLIKRLKDFKEENRVLFQVAATAPKQVVQAITEDNPNYPEEPQDGMILFDETIGELKIYSSGDWVPLAATRESLNPLPEEEPKPKKKFKPAKPGQRKVKFTKNDES